MLVDNLLVALLRLEQGVHEYSSTSLWNCSKTMLFYIQPLYHTNGLHTAPADRHRIVIRHKWRPDPKQDRRPTLDHHPALYKSPAQQLRIVCDPNCPSLAAL